MSNYTEKQVQHMIDRYTANPCLETVDKLTVELNKPRKSVIAKLVKLGVYQTRGYRTKLGEVPVTKLELVREIEDALDCKLPGLDKAPKPTIKRLADSVTEATSYLETSLEELARANSILETQSEMLKHNKSDVDDDDPMTIISEGM